MHEQRADDDKPSEGSCAQQHRVIEIGRTTDPDPATNHWLHRSTEERFAALEACREAFYGRAAVRGRLARVLTITHQAEGTNRGQAPIEDRHLSPPGDVLVQRVRLARQPTVRDSRSAT